VKQNHDYNGRHGLNGHLQPDGQGHCLSSACCDGCQCDSSRIEWYSASFLEETDPTSARGSRHLINTDLDADDINIIAPDFVNRPIQIREDSEPPQVYRERLQTRPLDMTGIDPNDVPDELHRLDVVGVARSRMLRARVTSRREYLENIHRKRWIHFKQLSDMRGEDGEDYGALWQDFSPHGPDDQYRPDFHAGNPILGMLNTADWPMEWHCTGINCTLDCDFSAGADQYRERFLSQNSSYDFSRVMSRFPQWTSLQVYMASLGVLEQRQRAHLVGVLHGACYNWEPTYCQGYSRIRFYHAIALGNDLVWDMFVNNRLDDPIDPTDIMFGKHIPAMLLFQLHLRRFVIPHICPQSSITTEEILERNFFVWFCLFQGFNSIRRLQKEKMGAFAMSSAFEREPNTFQHYDGLNPPLQKLACFMRDCLQVVVCLEAIPEFKQSEEAWQITVHMLRDLFHISGLEPLPEELTEHEARVLSRRWWKELRGDQCDYDDLIGGLRNHNKAYRNHNQNPDCREDTTESFQHWPTLPMSDYYKAIQPPPTSYHVITSMDTIAPVSLNVHDPWL
jgi:hypothetical protein